MLAVEHFLVAKNVSGFKFRDLLEQHFCSLKSGYGIYIRKSVRKNPRHMRISTVRNQKEIINKQTSINHVLLFYRQNLNSIG